MNTPMVHTPMLSMDITILCLNAELGVAVEDHHLADHQRVVHQGVVRQAVPQAGVTVIIVRVLLGPTIITVMLAVTTITVDTDRMDMATTMAAVTAVLHILLQIKSFHGDRLPH